MSDHNGGEHISPILDYLKVYGALLFLTVVTVAVSFMGFGQLAIYVAMAVAIVKALLVAGIFMHLKWDDKFNVLVFAASILFMVIFFGFTALDLGYRGQVNPETDTFVLRNEQKAMADEEAASAAAAEAEGVGIPVPESDEPAVKPGAMDEPPAQLPSGRE